ncbi:MAG: Crp/Fnr family transcriptional regulator [Bacteroidota bacterium]
MEQFQDQQSLYDHLNRFMPIAADELEQAMPYFESRELEKGEYLVKAGQVCREIAFIAEGMVRSYYEINGKEVTRFVLLRHRFVTALASCTSGQPSREYIQAIAPCRLLVIPYPKLLELYDRFPNWNRLGRLVVEQSHVELEERMLSLLSLNAEERYQVLSLEQPELLRNVPLQYIASILGIKPETLSRIRRKLLV